MFTKVDVPASSLALQSLIEASSSSLEHGWEVGWSLASYDNDLQTSIDIIRTPVSLVFFQNIYFSQLVYSNFWKY